MSFYEPDPAMLRYGITSCWHCGCLPTLHHTDTRCYTADEIGERLREYQRSGRWPGPDDTYLPQDAPIVLDLDPDPGSGPGQAVQREERP
jgi:hypothetical protein